MNCLWWVDIIIVCLRCNLIKKKSPEFFEASVGVDGIEPPTLCL